MFAAPPDVLALFAGEAKGSELGMARACGGDAGRVQVMAANEPPPASLSPEAASIYRNAVITRAGGAGDKPSPDVCAALRRRADLMPLFPPPPPPTKAERLAAAERRAKLTPAYCAEGTEAVLRDPTVTNGLRAIREKCNPGDTIAVPATAIGIIGSACDLSKPVPVAETNVFCTIGRIRDMRANR